LLFIAQDSIKHSKILQSLSTCISKSFESKEECPKIQGKAWENVVAFAKKESIKQTPLTDEEICSQINEMILLENTMSEEYLTTLHLKLLKFQMDENQTNIMMVQKLVDFIVEDEARHKAILDHIMRMLQKKNKSPAC